MVDVVETFLEFLLNNLLTILLHHSYDKFFLLLHITHVAFSTSKAMLTSCIPKSALIKAFIIPKSALIKAFIIHILVFKDIMFSIKCCQSTHAKERRFRDTINCHNIFTSFCFSIAIKIHYQSLKYPVRAIDHSSFKNWCYQLFC